MKKIVGWFVLAAATLAISLCVLKAAVYFTAWLHQRQAERILAAVAKLQPGVTTVSDLRQKVFSIDPQFGANCGDGERNGTAYASIYNFPSWKLFDNDQTPEVIRMLEGKLILPRWTMFSVSLTCSSGLLVDMRVTEMQEASGWPHPYADSSEFLPQNSTANAHAADSAPKDKDYWIYEQGTALYDGDRMVKESPPLGRFIFITPNATAEEKRRALEFHLDCFTRWSGCQDVNLILQPASKRV